MSFAGERGETTDLTPAEQAKALRAQDTLLADGFDVLRPGGPYPAIDTLPSPP
jgi:hypothetical protein